MKPVGWIFVWTGIRRLTTTNKLKRDFELWRT